MITSLHGDIITQREAGDMRVIQARTPLGIIWSVYRAGQPFGMKTGCTEAEAWGKWVAAHPVRVAA